MGSFSIFNWIGLLIPAAVIYGLYRILKKPPTQVMPTDEGAAVVAVVEAPGAAISEYVDVAVPGGADDAQPGAYPLLSDPVGAGESRSQDRHRQ